MNKRIKELIAQCVIIEEHSNGLRYEAGFDKEKFAELIINECGDVAFAKAPSDESACEISLAIKEHFGVEE